MDVLARIGLRYGAGVLVAKGFLAPDLGNQLAIDPDVFQFVTISLGLVLGAVSEAWYWLAKKLGWNT